MRTFAKLIFCFWICAFTGQAVACTLATEVASADAMAEAIDCFNLESAGAGQYTITLVADITPSTAFPVISAFSASRLRIVGNGYVINGSQADTAEDFLFQVEGEDALDEYDTPSQTVFDGVEIQDSTLIAIGVFLRHRLVLVNSRILGGTSFGIVGFESDIELRDNTEVINNFVGVELALEDTLIVDNSRIENNLLDGVQFGGFLSQIFLQNGSSISFNGGAGVRSTEGGARSVTMTDSRVVGNGADGVVASGTDEGFVSNMTIANNGGVGLYLEGEAQFGFDDQISIIGSTISGNASVGVELQSGNAVLIQNSSISGNGTHGVHYPNADFFTPGNIAIANSTLVDNLGYGALTGSSVPVVLHSNLFANNGAGNCGSNTSTTHSLSVIADDDSCAGSAALPEAKLYGYLQDNGCELAVETATCTATQELLTRSAALATGNCAGLSSTLPAVPEIDTDQRGLPRPTACAAGAYEPQGRPQPGKLLSAGGWHLLSFPLAPPAEADTIADVLGRDLPIEQLGNTWAMHVYQSGNTPASDSYVAVLPTDRVQVGRAYWLIQYSSSPLKIQLPSGSTPMAASSDCPAGLASCYVSAPLISNPTSNARLVRWDSAGHPTRAEVDFATTRYVTDAVGGTNTPQCLSGCTPAQAQGEVIADGIVANRINVYDGGPNYEVITSASGRLLREWDAFWIPMLQGSAGLDVRWVFPAEDTP